jgi:hypothetical protein
MPGMVFSFREWVFTMPGTGVQVGSESVFSWGRRTQPRVEFPLDPRHLNAISYRVGHPTSLARGMSDAAGTNQRHAKASRNAQRALWRHEWDSLGA